MKKKLSLFIYSLAGGGAERVVSILLNELKIRYDITLVLMRDKVDYDLPKDTRIYLLEDSNPMESGFKKLLKLPILGLKYKKICKDNNIDISITFMNRPSYVAIFSKLFGNSVYNIISERTTPSMIYRENNLLSRISKNLIKKLYPKADLIIANAEGNRIDLIDNFKIDKNMIVTIQNLFDLKKIELLSNKIVPRIEFNKFTFISVGRLDSGKNHRLMIKAFARLEDSRSQLIILGEGDQRSYLEKQVKDLGLEKRVFLLGFDNNPYKYFSKSDIFLFSSRYEGFPNVLVEALACGLPVISTDCKSGPREIWTPRLDIGLQLKEGLEFGEYGILTPIDNEEEFLKAMNILYKGKKIRDRYKKRAKIRAKDFDKEVLIGHFIEKIERNL